MFIKKTDTCAGRVLYALLPLLLLMSTAISCRKEPKQETVQDTPGQSGDKPSRDDPDYDPLVVRDGLARFYLYETPESVRDAFGVTIRDWTSFTVTIGGKDYTPAVDDDGRAFVDVQESVAGTYNAVLTSEASSSYLGVSKYIGLHHPFALCFHTLKGMISAFPLYASYSEKTGGRLYFSSACSLVELNICGDALLTSVRLENPSGEYMAGIGNYLVSKKMFSITEGLPFVVLNCTNLGAFVKLSDAGTRILIPVCPGFYSDGLDITLCDSSHKMMKMHAGAFDAVTDGIHRIDVNYAPEKDLLFYEGFDNFVWGGDIMAGSGGIGFAPSDEAVNVSSGTKLLGYESALVKVPYDRAGTGFIQPENYTEVSATGSTLGTVHQMSASYIRSRNLADYRMMYRCQEYQGYVAVGAGNTWRGIFEPQVIPGVTTLSDIIISFDYCPKTGFNDNLELDIVNGGKIITCTVDGADAVLEDALSHNEGSVSKCVLAKNAVPVPAGAASEKEWRHVECKVRNVNDNSRFRLYAMDASEGIHGFYLDNFEIRLLRENDKNPLVGLRVLYWNIQNGMWADQDNNYDNFVEWVRKYDPDVCVWCEGETIFDKQGVRIKLADRMLPTGWNVLAARYGHNYVSKGEDRDNYPQIITSKYPITTVARIGNTDVEGCPISHGAGHFRVTFQGFTVDFISFHAWPQKYSYTVNSSDEAAQTASAAANEGDLYREFEIKYICGNVWNQSMENCLMMGDFNSKSREDIEYYDQSLPSTTWLVHDCVAQMTDLVDVIAAYNDPDDYFSSVNGDAQRIDFMYASPKMFSRIANAAILIDSWTTISRDMSVTTGYFCNPSDHRPILVDFNMK